LPAGERRGRFVGLDAHGRLQLETPEGPAVIDAGDLFFPNLFTKSDVRNDAL
jgi:BirA family biotin operon repressor/biotin-[acetyl-CoA-carboxylase] ligase